MFLGPFPPDDSEDRGELQQTFQDIPRETLRAFVLAAVLAQGGLFAASLGVMLAVFREQLGLGGVLLIGGLLALAGSFGVYRNYRDSE